MFQAGSGVSGLGIAGQGIEAGVVLQAKGTGSQPRDHKVSAGQGPRDGIAGIAGPGDPGQGGAGPRDRPERAARAGQEMGSQGQGFAGQGIVCKTKSLLRTSFSQNLCTIIMQLLQGTRLEVYLTRVQDNLYHTWSTHC